MEYWNSMKRVADDIAKEDSYVKELKDNGARWHDQYATLNFFRYVCVHIGNLKNSEIERMVLRLKELDAAAVLNHKKGGFWNFKYDVLYYVLTENDICRKVCKKNKYSCWESIISRYCI
ncbi:MAG: hypothetical protein ACLT50_00660 [Mediterraneibacter faecis]